VVSRRALLALVAALPLAGVAHADATVAAPPTADPLARCTMQDGPIRRAWASKLDEKARAAGGPSVSLSAIGRRHLLLTSWWSDKPPRTVILRAGELERVATLEGTRAPGLVEDEGGALIGVLAIDGLKNRDEQLRLLALDGTTRWTSPPLPLAGADSVVVAATGDLLVVATFHRIATGSSLFALDRKSGALRWRADVEQLGVGHSKYWNDVALAVEEGRVVMRGFEAAGCYEQTFDVATGRRLSSRIRKTW
jgi:hypothetical protein